MSDIKFNPQLKIELSRLLEDGTEQPMNIPILEGEDLRNYFGNEPMHVDVSLSMSMTSNQDRATITLHNSKFFETIFTDYYALIEEMKDQMWRVKIWHWYSNSMAATEPLYGPMFVGEMKANFTTTSGGTTSSAVTLNAESHYRSNTFGKYRKTHDAGINYEDITFDMFGFMQENMGYDQGIIVDKDKSLLLKENIRPLSMNRNVGEELNDICTENDFIFSVQNNIPILMKKNEHFDPAELPVEVSRVDVPLISARTGKTSINNFGIRTISTSTLPDNEYFPGRLVYVTDAPQLTGDGFLDARIDSINAKLSNYGSSNMDIEMSVVKDGKVVMPDRLENSGGREIV